VIERVNGGSVAELIVLKFDSTYGADAALSAVRALEEMHYLWVDDVATVEKHKHGHVSLHTPHGSPATGAWLGGLLGMLLFFWFPPVWFLGATFGGAAIGAAIGDAMKHAGIDSTLTDRVKGLLADGTSALLLIGASGDADEMAHAFRPYKPVEVIREQLDDHALEDLSDRLKD
jgi:uncharacterized membrane protein